MAVINIIFTVSMVLLIFRFWTGAGVTSRILMVVGLLIFPVLQPLLIFLRSRKIVGRMPGDLEMTFNQTGIEIANCNKSNCVDYSEVKSVIWIFRMLIIYTRSKQGFILDDEVLSDKGKNLSVFLSEKIKGSS